MTLQLHSLTSQLSPYFEAALDLLLPRQCYGCHTFCETLVCRKCLSSISIDLSLVEDSELEFECFFLTQYEGIIKHLLHQLKFEGIKEMGPILMTLIADELAKFDWSAIDLIIPVPIHPRRFKRRGYNQVDLIFEPIAACFGTYHPVIERAINTPPLFELSKEQRQVVIQDAFRLSEGESVRDKRVLVIDVVVLGVVYRLYRPLLAKL